MKTIHAALIISVIANALLGVGYWRIAGEHETLRAWACEMGNGGAECGEE